jgi:hypothetical protein
MQGSIRRLDLVAQLTVCLTGCHTWRTQTVSRREVVETQHPERIRVSLTNQSELTLEAPEVQGDTLLGQIGQEQDQRRLGIPLASVERIAIRQADRGKTAVAAALGAGGAVVLFGLLSLAINHRTDPAPQLALPGEWSRVSQKHPADQVLGRRMGVGESQP